MNRTDGFQKLENVAMDVFARPRRVEHVHDDAGRARHVRMLRESERKTEAREDRARGHGGGIKCARDDG